MRILHNKEPERSWRCNSWAHIVYLLSHKPSTTSGNITEKDLAKTPRRRGDRVSFSQLPGVGSEKEPQVEVTNHFSSTLSLYPGYDRRQNLNKFGKTGITLRQGQILSQVWCYFCKELDIPTTEFRHRVQIKMSWKTLHKQAEQRGDPKKISHRI